MVEYQTPFSDKIAARDPLPGPLHLSELDDFLSRYGHRYPLVRWPDHMGDSRGDIPYEDASPDSPMRLS